MTGIVWCRYSVDGEKQLDKIINDYIRMNSEIEKQTTHPRQVIFSNGDRWKVCRITDGARGNSCNVSYISTDADIEEINLIVKPATKAYPYQAFKYYTP